MRHKYMLLGDEAFALGAIKSGLSGAYAYPGTPSTEITEYIQCNSIARERNIHSQWSTNEKTAYEEALGMSYCGKRAIVSMKHVGLNVAADPFVNSAMTGVNGGLLLSVADDPSMHSSQNEQDSRWYGKFALVPVLEPSNQQEAYDMAGYAFELSEKYKVPVMVRFVTRLSHSRGVVNDYLDTRDENNITFPEHGDAKRWVLMPGNSRKRYPQLIDTYKALAEVSETSPFNAYIDGTDRRLGIVASGIAFNYINELFPDGVPFPMVKISQYPLPETMISRLRENTAALLVIEEGQPLIEEMLYTTGVTGEKPVYGKLTGALNRTGELTPDAVRAALVTLTPGVVSELPEQVLAGLTADVLVPRPPALCVGCGHRDVYNALNEVLKEYDSPRVFGDIGCYTLGYLSPFHAIHTVVDMGASITMAKGAADAGQSPAVAIIGDSTFTHSGITGLLDAVNENSPITIIISDNLTTGMTGGQDSQGTGKLENICLGIGVAPLHLHTVDAHPRNIEEMKNMMREEINYSGLSVIISRRECIQTARRHAADKSNKSTTRP